MWTKPNVVPVHKKEDKMSAKSYCLISSFPTFGKMFHRVIYNSFFHYFLRNRLLTLSQPVFLPEDSCTAQLLT